MTFFKGCSDGVHRFEGRYDKGPSCMASKGGSLKSILALTEKFRKVTYIYDICIRCGKVVERP